MNDVYMAARSGGSCWTCVVMDAAVRLLQLPGWLAYEGDVYTHPCHFRC